MITRRQSFGLFAAAAAGLFQRNAAKASQNSSGQGRLGLVTYCCRLRQRLQKQNEAQVDLFEPLAFLEHCRKLGAGGMQISLGAMQPKEAVALRRRAEQQGMFIEAIVGVPHERSGLEQFDQRMRTAAAVGAKAVRTTIIPGRRYEYFDSLEKFRTFAKRGRRALELAAPIAEKHRLPLAVENHKDQRIDERVALFEQISSEYVGACVDTGNSVALLENAVDTATALAPWARSVHLKDQAVQLYRDGFLLGDIPLGEGFLDLTEIVRILRQARPDIRFSLELITRDPLMVPCLTDKYWITFPNVPGRDLARMLRDVRNRAAKQLQYISSLPLEQQVKREDENVRSSLKYAREKLNL